MVVREDRKWKKPFVEDFYLWWKQTLQNQRTVCFPPLPSVWTLGFKGQEGSGAFLGEVNNDQSSKSQTKTWCN